MVDRNVPAGGPLSRRSFSARLMAAPLTVSLADGLAPPDGLARIDAELRRVYNAAGVPDRWVLHHTEAGHQETPEMRIQIPDFLKKYL